jgi:Ca-activated chloride channel family protein
MKAPALALAVLFAIGGTVPAGDARPLPDAVLTGTVTDATTGNALPGAQVTAGNALRAGVGSLSDASGSYVLALEGDGWIGTEVTVRVQLIGYAAWEKTVTLAAGTTTVDVALTAQAVAVEGLVVTAAGLEGRVVEERARRSGQAAVAASVAAFEANPVAAVSFRQGLPGRYNPNFQTESYAHLVENRFLDAETNPHSTFSIDVDRASYSNVRRFIREGRRPPVDAVRIEELVNYFSYQDPEPRSDVPFSIATEVAPAPWQPLHHLVRIGLKGRSVDLEDIPPGNLVFLLDVSGSMRPANKLPLVKTALRMLVDQLRPEDRVAIVVYAGAAGLVLEPTPGDERDTILDAIERLEAGGSTAGGAGLALAYEIARKNHVPGGNNRVILATDGDFNIGPSSDSEMIRLIEEKREQGTFLTVLGFGTGNLKDSKMEQLADHGNGSFAYIDSSLEAKKVLVNELGGTLLTIAKDVKLQVEFNPARVAAYRLIGYENRMLAAEDFDDDTKDAGELGAGLSVTALYEVVPVGIEGTVDSRHVGELRYQSTTARPAASDSPEVLFVKLRYKEPTATESRLLERPLLASALTRNPSENLRFAAAVAAWGMLLRDSEHVGDFTLAEVADLAGGALGEDREGYRAEFLQLVDQTRAMEVLAKAPGS